jgi:hypothetical protein
MTAHIIAAELVRKMPELIKDSPLNQMLTIEAMLLEFQDRIVEQAVTAAFNAVGVKAVCEVDAKTDKQLLQSEKNLI